MTIDRKATMRIVGYFVAGLVGAFLSGFAAILGAMLLFGAGLGFLSLYLLVGGWILGGLVALFAVPCAVASKSADRNPLLHPAILPLLVSFLGGAVGPFVGDRVAEAEKRRYRAARAFEQAEQAEYDRHYERIRHDRHIVFREGWLSLYDARGRAAFAALSDASMNYTLDELDQALSENWRATPAFQNPICTPAFLARHFQGAYDRAGKIDLRPLAAIVSNTNTPLHLIEKVAYSKELPWGTVSPARESLKKLTGVKFDD